MCWLNCKLVHLNCKTFCQSYVTSGGDNTHLQYNKVVPCYKEKKHYMWVRCFVNSSTRELFCRFILLISVSFLLFETICLPPCSDHLLFSLFFVLFLSQFLSPCLVRLWSAGLTLLLDLQVQWYPNVSWTNHHYLSEYFMPSFYMKIISTLFLYGSTNMCWIRQLLLS